MMDWLQVFTLGGAILGGIWVMHRETAKEMKDFHGRLCRLEEKYQQMMERYLEKR